MPPEISITKNEQSGSEMTISWQADNQFALEFSYMLEPLEVEWSEWNADTSAYYNHLDENDYVFKVKSRYEEGSEQEIPDSVLFTINSIAGPGLRFFPLYMEVDTSSTFTMDIYAEEVTGLIGAEISCSYDPSLVVLDTTAISAGSFLSAASGIPIIIKEYDVEAGSLILTVATSTLEDGTDLGGGRQAFRAPVLWYSFPLLPYLREHLFFLFPIHPYMFRKMHLKQLFYIYL